MDAIWQAEQNLRLDNLKRRAPMGTRWRKKSGASWQGRVVGYYTTTLTGEGVCIESEREPGSVQIYPLKALEAVT